MGWGQELHAQHLTLDWLCRKGWLAQDTRATAIVIFSRHQPHDFLCRYRGNGFGHRSVVLKILKSLMLEGPGCKIQQLTCKHEMQSLALQLIPQLLLKSRVVLQSPKPHTFSLLD